MVINDFIEALHEDEKELAKKYTDEKGTDWNAYITEKEKTGFCKFDDWYFMDYSHITTQISSRYNNKWGTRIVGVTFNDRKIDIQMYLLGFRPVKKVCRSNIYEIIKEEKGVVTERGKGAILDIINPYQAVGHGISFTTPIEKDDIERSEILQQCMGVSNYNLKAMTFIWINHDLMVLALHEDENFVDSE